MMHCLHFTAALSNLRMLRMPNRLRWNKYVASSLQEIEYLGYVCHSFGGHFADRSLPRKDRGFGPQINSVVYAILVASDLVVEVGHCEFHLDHHRHDAKHRKQQRIIGESFASFGEYLASTEPVPDAVRRPADRPMQRRRAMYFRFRRDGLRGGGGGRLATR